MQYAIAKASRDFMVREANRPHAGHSYVMALCKATIIGLAALLLAARAGELHGSASNVLKCNHHGKACARSFSLYATEPPQE
jgi:hypothetical protein